MDYTLAKKLNDAGFQCSHTMDMDSGTWCTHCPYDRAKSDSGFEDMCFPTLSELIEACGEQFASLTRHYPSGFWDAATDGFEYQANTPEEAVANLWLLLNKK